MQYPEYVYGRASILLYSPLCLSARNCVLLLLLPVPPKYTVVVVITSIIASRIIDLVLDGWPDKTGAGEGILAMVCVANITQLDPSLFVANSNNAGRASNPHESLIPDGVVDVCCECIEFVCKGRDAGKQGRTMTMVRSDPNPTRPFAKIISIRMLEGSGGQTSSPHFSNAKLYYYRFHTSQDEPNTRITVMALLCSAAAATQSHTSVIGGGKDRGRAQIQSQG